MKPGYSLIDGVQCILEPQITYDGDTSKCCRSFHLPASPEEIVKDYENFLETGKAKWGLGIVTGNNTKFISSYPQKEYIPIYKGSDILKDGRNRVSIFLLLNELINRGKRSKKIK